MYAFLLPTEMLVILVVESEYIRFNNLVSDLSCQPHTGLATFKANVTHACPSIHTPTEFRDLIEHGVTSRIRIKSLFSRHAVHLFFGNKLGTSEAFSRTALRLRFLFSVIASDTTHDFRRS
jgi:hypothetical protein